MSSIVEPDKAVQGWRDQIEENERLHHLILDHREQVEELGRLNKQVLFEAQRYQSLYREASEQADYYQRRAAMLEGQLRALAALSEQTSASLMHISSMSIIAAEAEPPAKSPAAPAVPPEVERFAPKPDAAARTLDDAVTSDAGDPPPAFIAPAADPRLPEVRLV